MQNLRKESIQNTLACQERMIGSLFLFNWSRSTDRPKLHHSVLGGLAVELCLQYDILKGRKSRRWKLKRLMAYIYCIASFLSDVGDSPKCTRRKHNLVVVDQRVLIHSTEDIATSYVVTDLV